MVPALYAHDPFLAVQHLLCMRWLDVPMELATLACQGWAIALIALVFVFLRERDPGRTVRAVLPALAALVLTGLAAQFLKREVHVPRPLGVYGPAAVHVLLRPLRADGFPSGHASAAAALAASTVRSYGRRAWPIVLLAIVGGVSRVYVGAHWVFDVAAGWTLGVAVAWVTALVWDRAQRAGAVPRSPPEGRWGSG